jgi:hypothetical protein
MFDDARAWFRDQELMKGISTSAILILMKDENAVNG